MCVEGDKEFKEAFDLTHKVLTTSKPPILGSYTIRLLGKRYFTKTENISMVSLLKVLMCSKVNQAHRELWPLFAGGTYAGCKLGQVDPTCPRNSIYLFNDENKTPLQVSSFSKLMPASNEGILSTKALAARVFSLQADTEKNSSEMKQLLKEWRTWYKYQKIAVPFLELTLKDEDEDLGASPSLKKRKTKHVLKDALTPVMQDLLQSIQGLYDANEEDNGEDMRCKLDVLKTNYTTLAELCEFPIPNNVGPTSQGSNDGSDESENDSLKVDTDDDEEDEENKKDDDVSGEDDE